MFWAFIYKSERQLGNPFSPLTPKEALVRGFKAAPMLGLTVGSQMLLQQKIERILVRLFPTHEKSDFSILMSSSAIVAVLASPGLAIINGFTQKHSIMRTLRHLTFKTVGAIAFRETPFVFALRLSDFASGFFKETYGQNKGIECAISFTTGALGSLLGHPADTALTLWQAGMKIQSLSHLMRGCTIRAVGVGGFSIFYKNGKEAIETYLRS